VALPAQPAEGLQGHPPRRTEIELFRTAELRVDAERPFRIYADGDPIGSTPATIRAVPGALRVLVP
jgi:diacylglycerol kinase family enzyme